MLPRIVSRYCLTQEELIDFAFEVLKEFSPDSLDRVSDEDVENWLGGKST